MAGHSKWANIKHRKGAQDAKRSKIFQKLSKEIMVAMKSDTNPDTNPRLKLAIEKAKSENMPNDNITKLLSKANQDTTSWSEVTYEGYGPGGVAIVVEALTDNLNRTSPAVKSTFTKGGGNLGAPGSVLYMFKTKGILVIDSEEITLEKAMELALESGASNIYEEQGVIIIETEQNDFLKIKDFFESNGIKNFIQSEVTKIAENKMELSEKELEKINKLTNALEELDDIQDVYTNIK